MGGDWWPKGSNVRLAQMLGIGRDKVGNGV